MSRAPHLHDATLLALHAGDLPLARAAEAKAHLSACSSCTRALEAFGLVYAGLSDARREPSPFASARMKRTLRVALAERGRPAPRLVRRSRALAAVALAGLSGAAVAMTASFPPFTGAADVVDERSAEPIVRLPAAATVEPVRVAPRLSSLGRPLAEPPPKAPVEPGARRRQPDRTAPRASVSASARFTSARHKAREPAPRASPPILEVEPSARGTVRVAVAPGTPSPEDALEQAWQRAIAGRGEPDWIALGDAFAQAGALERAADAWVRGLASRADVTAAERLSSAAREDLVDESALLARLDEDASGSAEALRLRCELGLRLRADRPAVEACQAFGRAYPLHPSARTLAMAAGQVAETRLLDLTLAVGEYSRALMVSEYAGVTSTDALLARARARAKLGDNVEGQADLRLYLHVAPEAYNRAEVRALAEELGVPRP